MSKTQPAASLREFVDLLEQAKALLARLEDAGLIPLDEPDNLGRVPFYNQRMEDVLGHNENAV